MLEYKKIKVTKMSKKNNNDLETYRLKSALEKLKTMKGFHTELISLYIPYNRKISEVTNYLKNEINESQNIKSKLTKKNVLNSINSLLGQLKNIKKVSENGLILFSGAIPTNNTKGTEKNELIIINPPEKITTFKYHCSNEFLILPLEKMLEIKETYGLITIGRKKSAVGYITGDYIEVSKEFTSGIHSKHKAGGQSQKRFERQIEEGERLFYKRISEYINDLFLSFEKLEGIFIGGPALSKNKFITNDKLDYRLKTKILDVVDIGYSGSEGIRALVNKIQDQIKNVKFIREKKIMEKFMKEISIESKLITYGLKEVQNALEIGAVDNLILSEKLDKNIINTLGEIAESMGTKITIISSNTEEGEMLSETFGGITAFLRRRLN